VEATSIRDRPAAGRWSGAAAGLSTLWGVRRVQDQAPSVTGVMWRFTVMGLLALTVVAAGTAYVSRQAGTEEGIAEAQRIGVLTGKGIVEPAITPEVIAGDPAALAVLDDVVRTAVLQDALVRVKLWEADGTIVYSDESLLIGERFPLDDDHLAVLASGTVSGAVSDLDHPENQFEQGERLLEVYVPVNGPDGEPLLYEAYFLYDGVAESGRRMWLTFAPVALGGLVALQLVQLPAAWSLARRLHGSYAERERLLRGAIEASELERRRIASDLHDGVVQDLSGVSYTLAALARQHHGEERRATTRASEQIRDSIRGLRSLLVDIYPPNLREEGLESALADLLARLESRAIAVRLDVAGIDGLQPATLMLLYRCAQEALRNVIKHAEASSVNVTVRREEDEVVLLVEDDGRGFDPSVAAAEGHLGLRLLHDLVTNAGGEAEITSVADSGTCVRILVPAP
jgi:two-component system, NarL family, sensor kinase